MTSNIFFYKNHKSKSCRVADKFWRFSIERRADRGSIAGGCFGGVFWDIASREPLIFVYCDGVFSWYHLLLLLLSRFYKLDQDFEKLDFAAKSTLPGDLSFLI